LVFEVILETLLAPKGRVEIERERERERDETRKVA